MFRTAKDKLYQSITEAQSYPSMSASTNKCVANAMLLIENGDYKIHSSNRGDVIVETTKSVYINKLVPINVINESCFQLTTLFDAKLVKMVYHSIKGVNSHGLIWGFTIKFVISKKVIEKWVQRS